MKMVAAVEMDGARSGARGEGQGECSAAPANMDARSALRFKSPMATRRMNAVGRFPRPLPPAPLLLFLALLLLSLPALAQRIQVEVIVFAYASPDAGAALSADDPDPVFEGMLLGAEGDAYQLLPSSALRLNGANDALARHARTRSLVHIGWQQDAGATREIRLRGRNTIKLNDPAHAASAENPELDGDISLRFGRGVEVHLDALLRVETRDSAGRPSGQQRFRLNSKRILNYGELHYLDHPALGAIVRVDQVEAVSGE